MKPLAETASAGWPITAVLVAATVAGQRFRAGRQRCALNSALHELRRPLQSLALALSAGPRLATPYPARGSLRLAIAALADLDREINGSTGPPPHMPLRCNTLLSAAVGRWRGRVQLGGGSIEFRRRDGDPLVLGDRAALAQALDNLIVNAIEHGGPEIVVAAACAGNRVLLTVADSGAAMRPPSRRNSPAAVIARLAGRSRRGHGLPVARRTAGLHGGRLALSRSEAGSVAMIELPLVSADAPRLAA